MILSDLPRQTEPIPASLLELRLGELQTALRAECDWVWELSLEIVAYRERLDAGFLDESLALLLMNRYHFRQLLATLMHCGVEARALDELLQELDSLIQGYRRISASLKAVLPSSQCSFTQLSYAS